MNILKKNLSDTSFTICPPMTSRVVSTNQRDNAEEN